MSWLFSTCCDTLISYGAVRVFLPLALHYVRVRGSPYPTCTPRSEQRRSLFWQKCCVLCFAVCGHAESAASMHVHSL